ncbi:9662_t:CDS:10 [Dentiscutata erythropus]|uniref:phosphatidate phosphatase n=1 Tax=Dentiscutata erythropus TaxID=1348616 RepID=A0A9N9EHQ1_9GLOM|nr:9662_t:CDS:10 [Dentiscutata erythropus]
MQSVYRLVSTVNQFYREINPSTLSGAIDVIVVQQPNGDLACSPFHVRFGKLSVLRPQEKKVEMTVNGKVVDFPMKIGEAGEAFFVFETDKMVPEEFQTSPLTGPTQPTLNEEPDFLDLSASSSQNLPVSKESAPIYDFGRNNVLGNDFGTEEGASDPENIADLSAISQDAVVAVGFSSDDETNAGKVVIQVDPATPEIEGKNLIKQTNLNIIEEINLEQDLKSEYDSGSNIILPEKSEMNGVPDHIPHEIRDEGVEHDTVQTNDTSYDDLSSTIETRSDSHSESKIDDVMTRQSSVDGELLEDEKLNNERSLSMPLIHSNWGKSEGPFSDTELDDPRKPEKMSERRIHGTSPLSDTELEYEPVKHSKNAEEWSWRWGALPVRKSDEMERWQESPGSKEWKDPEKQVENTSGVHIGDKTYSFEMSLCGGDNFGKDEKTDAELFHKHLISFEHFMKNPQLLNDKALVFKYENRYLTWATAAPLIISLVVFKQPLPDSSMALLTSDNSEDKRRYSLRGFSRWWNRSSSKSADTIKENSEDEAQNNEKNENTSKPQEENQFYAKTLRLTSEQLKSLNLKKGANTMTFTVQTYYQGKSTCVAKLFYWDNDTQIVISDIDGTITKSDALGHVFTMIGKDWTHYGVAKLYSDIHKNGYQILYLTSRAIGQAHYTRDYLEKVKQDKYQLPDGPVIMSPDRLLTAFHREVIMRKPEVFKIACLRDVKKLFGDRNPFYGGFGNRITDALSYRSVNVSSSRIFTIDPNGEVKLELLSGYKSSYFDLSDLVDQMFPHIGNKWDTVYNDWNYWKPNLLEIELPPEIYDVSPPKSPSNSPILGSNDLPNKPLRIQTAPGILESSVLASSTGLPDTDNQYDEDDSDFEEDIPAEEDIPGEIDLRDYPY